MFFFITSEVVFQWRYLGLGLREEEGDILTSQLLIDRRESIELTLNVLLILLVQEDLEDLAAVESDTGALSDDLCWVNKILKNGLVNSSQSTGVGALLLSNTVVATSLGEDAALANNNNVLGELLLKLANKASLDTVSVTEEAERNKDDDGLLTSANIDLLGRSEVPVLKLALKLSGGVGLQLENLLGNGVLKRRRLALSLLLLKDLFKTHRK